MTATATKLSTLTRGYIATQTVLGANPQCLYPLNAQAMVSPLEQLCVQGAGEVLATAATTRAGESNVLDIAGSMG